MLNPRYGTTRYQQAHCRDIVKYLRNAICNIFHLRNICAIENLDIKANLTLFAKTKKITHVYEKLQARLSFCQGFVKTPKAPVKDLSRKKLAQIIAFNFICGEN